MKDLRSFFADGWNPHGCKAASRFALFIRHDLLTQERTITRLCAAWREQAFVTAYLESDAPFVQNLSMLENLWLPVTWRRSVSTASIVQKSEQLLPLLGWSKRDLHQLMSCRPGDLAPNLIGKLQLLRAALMEPEWVIIDPSWFLNPLLPCQQSVELAEALIGNSKWLLLWESEGLPLPSEVTWVRIDMI